MTVDLTPLDDPYDRRRARSATGLLRDFNASGVLTAADVHVASRLARLGAESDEQVLLAAALTVRAVRQGSVCLDLETVREIAPDLPWPGAAGWREAVATSSLVGAGDSGPAGMPLRLHDGLLYLDRYWVEESQVCTDLLRRAEVTPPPVDDTRLAQALAQYFPGDGYAEQRAAAEVAARHWTSVITGGPGTGKTTTIARFLAALQDCSDQPLQVALAAPTGKAAARMGQAVATAAQDEDFPQHQRARVTGLRASTMHRLLGWVPDSRTRFRHHRGNQLPHDVVVIDETSMVSLTLMARLLEAVRPDARLVLVGDADQLASVDAGAVLKDLVDGLGARGEPPIARLQTSHRFGGQIGALAAAIRAGDGDGAVAALTSGEAAACLVDHDGARDIVMPAVEALVGAAEAGLRQDAVTALDTHRLLCAHREGPYGVRHWNRQVERWLLEGMGSDWLPQWYPGQPLIVTANDYGLGLFNGDTGVVCRAAPGSPDLLALIADGEHPAGRAYQLTRLGDVAPAHAITVHRSQGSQFDSVTVLLPDAQSPILTRELIYTAVTRARSAVRVVGTQDAVRAAVGRRAQRATGLAKRLAAG